jgi:hypothetical protein
MRDSGFSGHKVQENSSIIFHPRAGLELARQNEVFGISVLQESLRAAPGSSQGQFQNEVRERYERLQQEQETREAQGLLGQQHQQEWFSQNQALGRTFLRSLLNMQIQDSLRRAERGSPEIAAVVKVQQKIDRVIMSGITVQTQSGFRFGSRADLPRQTGRVWMSSPLLHGSVDFRVGGDTGLAEPGAGRSGASPEALQVTVGRELPWEIQSGVIYGGTSQTVTTQLSRPISPHLTCSVENREGIRDSSSEQTARINYQLRF